MAFLEVSNLKRVLGGNIHAIKNISFHVNEGEIVSIIGATEYGKTILQTTSGLIKAKSGQISFLTELI